MTKQVTKQPHVSICRTCSGTGMIESFNHPDGRMTCPQCEGSGRLVVSCQMTVDIRPYKEGETL